MTLTVPDSIQQLGKTKDSMALGGRSKNDPSTMVSKPRSFGTLLGRVLDTTATDPTGTDVPHPSVVRRLVAWIEREMNALLFDAVGATPLGETLADPFLGRPTGIADLPRACEATAGQVNGKTADAPQNTAGPEVNAGDTESIIKQAADRYDVDPHLIRAVIRAESNFDPTATSSQGAQGLMQLMPQTAQELGVTDAYDPSENIMGGTRYLRGLLDRYDGNTPLALAAYNWGMGNVERHPGRLPEETRTYIARVNTYFRESVSA